MIKDSIRYALNDAVRNRDETKKNILRVVLGEIEGAVARSKDGKDLTDDQVIAIIKKIVIANTEVKNQLALWAMSDENQNKIEVLLQENDILSTFLPQVMSLAEIENFIADKSFTAHYGKATGEAMKMIKAAGLTADGNDVKEAVARFIDRHTQ